MLKDKILEAACAEIERHAGVPAVAEGWIVRGAYQGRRHQIEVSVSVSTNQGYELFEVWVAVDMDTEEVTRITA